MNYTQSDHGAVRLGDAVDLVLRRMRHQGEHRAHLEHEIERVLERFRKSLGDGNEILELFEQMRSDMTDEERQEFLAGFVDSVGSVMNTTSAEFRRIFNEHVRGREARKEQ